jgi:chitinase
VALNAENSTLNAYPAYNPSNTKIGDRWDGEGGLDVCGVMQGPGGVYTYWGLIEEGFLKSDGSPGKDIVVRYDDCSETACETLNPPFPQPFLPLSNHP